MLFPSSRFPEQFTKSTNEATKRKGDEIMRWRSIVLGLLALAGTVVAVAWASTFSAGPLVLVSAGPSPFAACTADNVPALQPGRNFPDAEVEPWVDVNPTNLRNIVGAWQQDRRPHGRHGNTWRPWGL